MTAVKTVVRRDSVDCEHDRGGLNEPVPVASDFDLAAAERRQIAVAGSVDILLRPELILIGVRYAGHRLNSAAIDHRADDLGLQKHPDPGFLQHHRKAVLRELEGRAHRITPGQTLHNLVADVGVLHIAENRSDKCGDETSADAAVALAQNDIDALARRRQSRRDSRRTSARDEHIALDIELFHKNFLSYRSKAPLIQLFYHFLLTK